MSSKEVIKQFSVPSKGTWIAFLICGVLLLVWISVELMFVNARLAGARPISGKEPGAVLVWTLAGIPLLIWLLWLLFGRERIALRRKYLTIRFEIAALGLPFPYVVMDSLLIMMWKQLQIFVWQSLRRAKEKA
jgi:hypothetical protein